MDTKSRKYNSWGRKLLFALCALSFIGMVAAAVYGLTLNNNTSNLYDGNLWYLLNPTEFDSQRAAEIWAMYGDQLTYIRTEMLIFMAAFLGLGLLCLGSFIALLVNSTGRDENGQFNLQPVDKWWSEIQILLLAFSGGAGGGMFLRFFYSAAINTRWVGLYQDENYYYAITEPAAVSYALAAMIGLVSAFLGLSMIVSLVRKLRAGVFIKHSIFGLLLFEPLKKVYFGGNTMRKVVLISLAACLLSATVLGAPVVFVLILVLGPKFVQKFDEIKKGVEEVNNGNLTYQIPVDPHSLSEVDSLGRAINRIFESSNVAVQNEIKNQKMKTELISNVSHDLRTPLTSIITYIDLLKTEEIPSEKAAEYLDVLEKKAARLKQLTDDLFEAAKASSGAMPVDFARVELVSLVRQALGEYDHKIQESKLQFVMSAPKEKFYVNADGQLMYRVMENLIGNALKYGQPDTRVYIDISSKVIGEHGHGVVSLEMKNVSRQALNIDAQELTERFKRGDEARSTDGSGLGLAIAKDLLKLQNGWLEIKIDGDLFKAIATLEEAEAPVGEEAEAPAEEEPEAPAEEEAQSGEEETSQEYEEVVPV